MGLIYNKAYKVPAWVVLNTNKTAASPIIKSFKELGAHEVIWMANTFPVTISILSTQGWAHEVNKKMPFFMNQDFLNFATAHHIRSFAGNKSLTGQSANAMSSINRSVTSVDDYVRIFNDVICNESDMALSHLLAIGELCHGEREQVKVFVSTGDVPKNILQRLADRVITVGGEGSDVSIEEIDDIVSRVAAILGYQK